MKFNDFAQIGVEWWNSYFAEIQKYQKQGRIEPKPRGSQVLFPTIVLATRCGDGYYILELIGATREFHPLKLKVHSDRSVYRYLNQFDPKQGSPIFCFDGHNTLRGLSFSRQEDLETVLARFPHVRLYPTNIKASCGQGTVFSFGPNFNHLIAEHCIIVNSSDRLTRCKAILWSVIVSSNITKQHLTDLLSYSTRDADVHGVYTAYGDEEDLLVSGQLQSMFLCPGLHETTIGEFIRQHPEVIKKAFNATGFVYEPYLKWIQHDGSVEDVAINPDLMVRREDGFYDIYDLKTALLSKPSITKGGRARRRFIDYVEEGISQLANYREYFEYTMNANHANEKYGIQVSAPRLVLVVGSFENSYPAQITQACRKHPDIQVIDFDTLCQMYIGIQIHDDTP